MAFGASAYAKDNGRVLFMGGGGGVFSVRPDGTGTRKLVSGAGSPVWSPTKEFIAYLRPVEDNAQLWVMSPDGTDSTLVADGVEYVTPAWSPDSSRLALVRTIDDPSTPGLTKQALFTVDADGANETLVAEAPHRDLGGPQWSPRSTHIAFVASIPSDDGDPLTVNERNVDIYSVRLDDGEVLRLTEHPDLDITPVWSPDGAQLAFVSDRDDTLCAPDGDGCPYTTEIYVMAADGTREQRMTHNKRKHDLDPAWSPTGAHIAWTQSIDDDVNINCCHSEVFVMGANGENKRRLTHNEKRTDSFPDFSPDGGWIVFAGGRYDGSRPRRDLYKVRVDGSGMTRMTKTDRRLEIQPDW
jgi:TolB protein